MRLPHPPEPFPQHSLCQGHRWVQKQEAVLVAPVQSKPVGVAPHCIFQRAGIQPCCLTKSHLQQPT